jgi:deoxyribonuclease-4
MKEQMIAEIKKILAATPENSRFLIENSAGQNGKIGSDLQEIRELINGVGSNRLGWCFDTCHAYSAGYHLGSHGADANQPSLLSESQKIKLAFDEIDHLSLWETLWCIHTNDSRDDYDSGRDRHENLGKGKIPVPEFMDWLNQSKLKDHALILEVPGIDNKGPDEANLKVLKGWIKR